MSGNSHITSDPSLDAVAAHRRAYVAFRAAEGGTAQRAAYEVEKEALDRLLRTKPATLSGAAVLLRYVLRHNEEECGRLTDKFDDHDDLLDFLETLADGLLPRQWVAGWPSEPGEVAASAFCRKW
jgi:hypothetical protein